MWNLKNSLLVVGISCIASISAGKCELDREPPQWEPRNSTAPALLLTGSILDGNETILIVTFHDQREDFNFTILANPFAKHVNDCKIRPDPYLLRKFHTSMIVKNNSNLHPPITVPKIFTGCYYFQMTNNEEKTWIPDQSFINTNYTYHDTMFKCKSSIVSPPKINKSKQLTFEIEIPNTCFNFECMLYELEKPAVGSLSKYAINRTCKLIYNGTGNKPIVNCDSVKPELKLIAMPVKSIGLRGWNTVVTWDNLGNGFTHYSTFSEYNSDSCNIRIEDLKTWQPFVTFRALNHGNSTYSNDLSNHSTPTENNSSYKIIFIIIGVIVAAILVYWITKLVKALMKQPPPDNETANKLEASVTMLDKKESNEILLMYVKSSSEFMKQMNILRDSLEQICECRIRAVYAEDQWQLIATISPRRWVEELLKRDSKVIWVDTPDLRSCLKNNDLEKDQRKHSDEGDFRDVAIPYALNLAKDLYHNPTTQYCHHFVVRLKALEVEDGRDDPLLVISPHARYYIPEQLSLLCEHLKDPRKCLTDTANSIV